MFTKWRFGKNYSGLMRMRDQNLVKVATGSETVIYDVESKKIIKPEGFMGGITKEDAAPPRYYAIPLSGGTIDS